MFGHNIQWALTWWNCCCVLLTGITAVTASNYTEWRKYPIYQAR